MATNYYTTTQLIEDMKLRGFIPTNSSGLTNTQLLRILTEELRVTIPAFLKSIREEFLIVSLDIPVTSTIIPAPSRAVAGSFRTIQWIDDSGNPQQLARIEPERACNYTNTGSKPVGYMFQGNNIVLVPAFSTGTLRVTYQQRPGILVLPEACCQVASINVSGDTTELTFTQPIPSGFINGTLVDVVSATPNFVALSIDNTFVVDSGPIYTITTIPGLAVGDFICLANETCIPQIPQELHELLAQAAALKIPQAQGSARYPQILASFNELKAQLTILLSPRSDGSARPIVHKGRYGSNAWGSGGGW